jgi:uncharacterized Tic20 family protein
MKPTTDERVIAVISHLIALAFGAGLVLPAIMWSENREKPSYIRFQTLQAMGYQSLGYTFWLIAQLLFFILFYIALFFVALLVPNAAQNKTIISIFMALFILSILGLLGIYLLLPVIAAIVCGMGKDFHYLLLGPRLARYLGYDSSNPDASLDSAAEERFAAAMGHFAVIIPIWGLLAPAYLWMSQGKKSAYLKFQSAQTAIYQVVVNLLLFGLSILAILLGIAAIPLSAIFLQSGEWAAVAGMMVMVLLLSLVWLVIPLFHILGQWAGWRVLQGKDFRYPLLGRLFAK